MMPSNVMQILLNYVKIHVLIQYQICLMIYILTILYENACNVMIWTIILDDIQM